VTSINIYWYVLPLAVAISLVYAASRHESWRRIFTHAARLCVSILLFLVVATAAMVGINLII
jgi:hypothetical protein